MARGWRQDVEQATGVEFLPDVRMEQQGEESVFSETILLPPAVQIMNVVTLVERSRQGQSRYQLLLGDKQVAERGSDSEESLMNWMTAVLTTELARLRYQAPITR